MGSAAVRSVACVFLLAAASLSALPADVETINDRDYLPKVLLCISGARSRVKVVIFSAIRYTAKRYRDSPSNLILDALAAAARRGLSVEVVLERGADSESASRAPDNRPAAAWLAKEGVAVYLDPVDRTTHAKLVVVDGNVAVIGSANWSYSALSRNRETGVIVRSAEIAAEYERYFDALREISTRYAD